ncbi:MAG: TRAFAC clade GTPase domain-containing protein [Actinomycetota bacterium]
MSLASSLAPGLVCPYCFARFSRRRILFRCQAKLTRTGTTCPIREDDRLLAYGVGRGVARLGPVFAAGGRRTRATCPSCRVETIKRVCPECHNELPSDFGQIDSRIIALVGAIGSGKSTYITVLIRELRHRVGEAFGAAVEPMDDRTINEYRIRFQRTLLTEGLMLASTQGARGLLNFPLLYRFILQRRRRYRSRKCSTALVFFDTAGEDLGSRDIMDLHARYFIQADGIIFLVDPFQIDAVRALVGADVALPDKARAPDEIIGDLTSLLRAAREIGPDHKIRTPVAVAFSKIDGIQPALRASSPLNRASSHHGYFDCSEQEELHDEIQALLQEWEGGVIERHLSHHYRTYAYFGLSALGAPPEDGRVARQGIAPFRVEDPVLWLLSRFGVIATRKAGKAR